MTQFTCNSPRPGRYSTRNHLYMSAGRDAGPFVLINTLHGLCIQPKAGLTSHSTGNSSATEPTQLLLLHDSCSDKSSNTQFIFTASGQLKHVSTGQCVSPIAPIQDVNNSPAVILSNCNPNMDSSEFNLTQWELTSGASLLHKQSGLCLHPEGGAPKPGIHLHLYKGCDQDRLEFMPIPPDQVAAALQPPSDKHLEVDVGRCAGGTQSLHNRRAETVSGCLVVWHNPSTVKH